MIFYIVEHMFDGLDIMLVSLIGTQVLAVTSCNRSPLKKYAPALRHRPVWRGHAREGCRLQAASRFEANCCAVVLATNCLQGPVCPRQVCRRQ